MKPAPFEYHAPASVDEACALLGTLDRGWYDLLDTLNCERIVTTAGCVATVDLALELATNYARHRVVFGDKPIGVGECGPIKLEIFLYCNELPGVSLSEIKS